MTRPDSTTPAAPVLVAAMAVAVLAVFPPNMTSPGFRIY